MRQMRLAPTVPRTQKQYKKKINFSICEKVQGSTELAPSSPDLVASLWSSPHHGKALQWSGAEHGLGGALPGGLSAGFGQSTWRGPRPVGTGQPEQPPALGSTLHEHCQQGSLSVGAAAQGGFASV